jgi:hypothetical protein
LKKVLFADGFGRQNNAKNRLPYRKVPQKSSALHFFAIFLQIF